MRTRLHVLPIGGGQLFVFGLAPPQRSQSTQEGNDKSRQPSRADARRLLAEMKAKIEQQQAALSQQGTQQLHLGQALVTSGRKQQRRTDSTSSQDHRTTQQPQTPLSAQATDQQPHKQQHDKYSAQLDQKGAQAATQKQSQGDPHQTKRNGTTAGSDPGGPAYTSSAGAPGQPHLEVMHPCSNAREVEGRYTPQPPRPGAQQRHWYDLPLGQVDTMRRLGRAQPGVWGWLAHWGLKRGGDGFAEGQRDVAGTWRTYGYDVGSTVMEGALVEGGQVEGAPQGEGGLGQAAQCQLCANKGGNVSISRTHEERPHTDTGGNVHTHTFKGVQRAPERVHPCATPLSGHSGSNCQTGAQSHTPMSDECLPSNQVLINAKRGPQDAHSAFNRVATTQPDEKYLKGDLARRKQRTATSDNLFLRIYNEMQQRWRNRGLIFRQGKRYFFRDQRPNYCGKYTGVRASIGWAVGQNQGLRIEQRGAHSSCHSRAVFSEQHDSLAPSTQNANTVGDGCSGTPVNSGVDQASSEQQQQSGREETSAERSESVWTKTEPRIKPEMDSSYFEAPATAGGPSGKDDTSVHKRSLHTSAGGPTGAGWQGVPRDVLLGVVDTEAAGRQKGRDYSAGRYVDRGQDFEAKWVRTVLGNFDVWDGGPVEGLTVLHSCRELGGQRVNRSSQFITQDIQQVARLVATNKMDAKQVRLFVGEAGWGPCQLEQEIVEGSWILISIDPEHLDVLNVGSKTAQKLWQTLLAHLGGDYAKLARIPAGAHEELVLEP